MKNTDNEKIKKLSQELSENLCEVTQIFINLNKLKTPARHLSAAINNAVIAYFRSSLEFLADAIQGNEGKISLIDINKKIIIERLDYIKKSLEIENDT